MRSRVWSAAALLCLGALSACTSAGDDREAPPSPAANAGIGDRQASRTAVVQVRDVDHLIFLTPSKNIGCDLETDSVRCDIGTHRWIAPSKPADCQLGWGNGVYMEKSGVADFMCAGDTLLGATTEILPYGHGVRAGDFRCDSASAALRCENENTGHGFTLSIQDYDVF